nr:MAG TPA: hypothetical protein [Caudoviricetes sp.]
MNIFPPSERRQSNESEKEQGGRDTPFSAHQWSLYPLGDESQS